MSTVSSAPHLGATPNGSATRRWSEPIAAAGGFAGVAAPVQEVHRAQSAVLLQRIHSWLERTVPSVPQCAQFIPPTLLAVELYKVRRNQECLAQAYLIAQSLQQIRVLNPALPPL